MKQWQDIWSERCAALAAVQSSGRQLEQEAIPAARTALQAGIDKVQRTFECEPCCCGKLIYVAVSPQLGCADGDNLPHCHAYLPILPCLPIYLPIPVNEAQYQLTVQRMGELKDAHEVQAALQHKHHVVSE